MRKQQDAERHHPKSNTGRKPKTPKMIRSSPTGTRTQPDDDPLSQRKKPPARLGEFVGYPIDLTVKSFGVTIAHRLSSAHIFRFTNDTAAISKRRP